MRPMPVPIRRPMPVDRRIRCIGNLLPMLTRAADDLTQIEPEPDLGDSVSDPAAGKAAGLPVGILVSDGYGARDAEAARVLADDGFEVIRR